MRIVACELYKPRFPKWILADYTLYGTKQQQTKISICPPVTSSENQRTSLVGIDVSWLISAKRCGVWVASAKDRY